MSSLLGTSRGLVLRLLILLLGAGCATAGQHSRGWAPDPAYDVTLPPPAPLLDADGGFTYDNGSLFAGRKARRLGDIITIRLVQDTRADAKADTKLGRKSSAKAGITALLGLDTALGKIEGINPEALIDTSASSDFEGTGGTNRSGVLEGTITARVVSVQAGGMLEVAARQAIRINNEVEYLGLRGLVDPRSIGANNTVNSTAIADLRIEYGGTGVVAGKQRPGVVSRALDLLWPF